MGKDNNNDNVKQTTTNEPWSGVRPYLLGAYKDAQNIYKQGAPGYYPGQTMAPMSGYTQGSIDAMAQRAAAGSDLTRAAQGQLTDTLSGQYLQQGNPYLQNAITAATRPMINAFNDQVMPGLDSNFSAAGRYGSGAHALASSDAGAQLQSQIGDVASQMAYNNYSDERQNQMRGMLFAPELAQQDYRDIGMLGQAGSTVDQYNQNLINNDINKWNYIQNKDFNYLKDYLGVLNGAQGGSMTQTIPNQSGGFGGAATGALGGALAGAQMGSIIPGIGTGIGALGGALIGGLGGWF